MPLRYTAMLTCWHGASTHDTPAHTRYTAHKICMDGTVSTTCAERGSSCEVSYGDGVWLVVDSQVQ